MAWDPTKPVTGGPLSSADIRANWAALDPLLTSPAIPTGTRMLFDQAAAPSGWTRDTTINDRAVRIVSGTAGVNAGTSWAVSGLTHAHTHTMASHTHSMQSHTHTLAAGGDGNVASGTSHEVFNLGGNLMAAPFGTGTAVATVSAATGGPSVASTGGPSNNTSDGASSSAVASDGNWRPLTRDVIVATKN